MVPAGGLPLGFAGGVRLKRKLNELSNPSDAPLVFRRAREEVDFLRVVLLPAGLPRLAVLRVDETLRLVFVYLRVGSLPPCLCCRGLLASVIFEAL
jgi:hypothetical protein